MLAPHQRETIRVQVGGSLMAIEALTNRCLEEPGHRVSGRARIAADLAS
jgi:hypothetical protein